MGGNVKAMLRNEFLRMVYNHSRGLLVLLGLMEDGVPIAAIGWPGEKASRGLSLRRQK